MVIWQFIKTGKSQRLSSCHCDRERARSCYNLSSCATHRELMLIIDYWGMQQRPPHLSVLLFKWNNSCAKSKAQNERCKEEKDHFQHLSNGNYKHRQLKKYWKLKNLQIYCHWNNNLFKDGCWYFLLKKFPLKLLKQLVT